MIDVPRQMPRSRTTGRWVKVSQSERVKRFWQLVEKSDGCWHWHGYVAQHGYGVFGRQPRQYAHRFVYELVRGPVPVGLQLDHLCRNRACVNPAHLEVVTFLENIRRGLRPSGSRNGKARLTESVVRAMRERRAAGESIKSIAADYNTRPNTASRAISGARWGHVK